MITAYDFVIDDWRDASWYEEQTPGTVEELAPYWNEFLQDCRSWGREIPEDLTLETYVTIWNELCERRS